MARAPIVLVIACLAAAGCARDDGDGLRIDTDSAGKDSGQVSAGGERTEAACAPSLWAGVIDTAASTAPRASRHRVNRGTNGMFSQIRWVKSPDGCALLVIQDPAAVEAEPVPNGVLFASERGGRVIQRDSVWSVAPSPDWRRIAFSAAHGMQPRGAADSLSNADWQRFARNVGVGVAALRRSAFSCSGMTYWFCTARLHVIELAEFRAADSSGRDTTRALPTLAGWRVRWANDSTILAGTGPRGSQDHDPPVSWLLVDPSAGRVRDTLPASDSTIAVPLSWSDGPMLTYGVAIDLASPSELSVDGATIRSEGGWINIRWPGPSGEHSFRVGAGRALAATRGGRFIAAIAPTGATSEREWAYEVVVYQITR